MEKTNLEMIRGDTFTFGFEVEFDEAPQELESVFFSCKKNYDDDEAIFQKKLGDGISYVKTDGNKLYYAVRVAPEDTENIEAGQYYYDLQIGTNGDVFTVLIGTLKIHNDVTMGTAIPPKPIETVGFSNEIVTFSQENNTAKAFVETAEKTYKDGDDYSSIVGNYSTSFPSDYQYPVGYDLTIPQAGTLLIQNESTGNGFESVSVSAGTKTIYNLIPDVTYRYILRDSNGDAYKTGRLQSTGSLRMIKVPNTCNFRDLGGWACNGGKVKYGLMLRGGPLSGGTPIYDCTDDDGKRAIRDFGILQEVDLRELSEVNNGTSDTADDIKSCVAGKHIRYNRFAIPADIKTSEDQSKVIANTMNLIMQNVADGIPTYFHCSAGADRTGVIAILLEALLGVSVVDIQIDYELTYFYTNRTRSTKKKDIEYLKSFNGKHSGIDWKTAVWATKYGISIDTINAFRAAAIDGTPETLAVPAKLAITQQPTDATAKVGESVTETITATGDWLTYLWEFRASSSCDWTSVAYLGLPATETSITVGYLQAEYTGYQLRCTVTDQYGNSVVSNVATLTVVEETYSVTNNLTNCSTSNTASAVEKGTSYSATITPSRGYAIDSVTVTMGGTDVTSSAVSGGAINIASVTGELTIIASAVSKYTNLLLTSVGSDGETIYNGTGYKDGYYASGADDHVDSNAVATGWIKLPADRDSSGDTIRIAGIVGLTESHTRAVIGYMKDGVMTSSNGWPNPWNGGTVPCFTASTEESEDHGTIAVLTQTLPYSGTLNITRLPYYMRFSFANSKGADILITLNTKID